MVHRDHGVHIAPGVEISHQLHPAGRGCRHQIIKDAIDHLLMGDGLIAPAVDVQLEGLELQHFGTGLIGELQAGEIGIAGERTLTGEFGQRDRHVVRAALARILETDQLSISDGPLAVGRPLGTGGGRRGSQRNQRISRKPDGCSECYATPWIACLKWDVAIILAKALHP